MKINKDSAARPLVDYVAGAASRSAAASAAVDSHLHPIMHVMQPRCTYRKFNLEPHILHTMHLCSYPSVFICTAKILLFCVVI